jgi:hypothetical protein
LCYPTDDSAVGVVVAIYVIVKPQMNFSVELGGNEIDLEYTDMLSFASQG